ncbi:MAG: bifunctional 4-hydroxy-2-oxoglutarate aldolase/2-dehydro-3-deoxy-phosphogluconate aldolase [Candidatus Thermoplasmatota archaeon]|nr:bifunctional 4-hydroxy-2-oxoglutarate aldolase/2-dehydro-3-deoxy-phosphogluconate aldolase [Candidatus Thermoplasmatota archaeon]
MNFSKISQKMLPVLNLSSCAQADLIAQLMEESNLTYLEITLRNDNAMTVLSHILSNYPKLIVGVGTITKSDDMVSVAESGAHFGVTPGMNSALYAAMKDSSLPIIPGVSTISEAMEAMEHGCDYVKLFPASQIGLNTVKSWLGPLEKISICATGGLDLNSAKEWLGVPQVKMVGGGWMAPKEILIEAVNGDAESLEILRNNFQQLY